MVAILLAFMIPGLGQIYNQQYAKGIAVFLCFGFGVVLAPGNPSRGLENPNAGAYSALCCRVQVVAA